MKYCLGIDIGGTKTEVCIADEGLNIIENKIFSTESQNGSEDLVERITFAYNELCGKLQIEKSQVVFAGVACPGPLDIKNGKIVHIATMGFRDVPIKEMLENALELTVFLENDANCAALAESAMGVGKGLDPLVYVTISTGVGCGIIVDGKILSGAYSSAGEIGHLTVEPNGKECACGKRGCLELYSSGTAIANSATAFMKTKISTKEVFALARTGDKSMLSIVNDAVDKLGLALSSVFHLIDPKVVVLGGSVTKDYDVFAKVLSESVCKFTQPVRVRNFDIRISNFNGQQVILGALIYARNLYFTK